MGHRYLLGCQIIAGYGRLAEKTSLQLRLQVNACGGRGRPAVVESLGSRFVQQLSKGKSGPVFLSAKKFFKKDVSFLTVRVISSQLYLSGDLTLEDREDS